MKSRQLTAHGTCRMKALVQFPLSGFLVVLIGCSLVVPKETVYLRAAQNLGMQAEVRERLGAPREETSTPDGESQWVYEVREVEASAQNTWATAGSWCDQYVLSFDRQGMRQGRTHKSYFHGGGTMPVRCDSGVLKSALQKEASDRMGGGGPPPESHATAAVSE